MSKKIICLLSLLIFLSLVFASCKQNGITGIKGDLNKEEEIKMDTGGIINSWSSLEGKTILNDYSVIPDAASDKDYYRNPVVVALGGANVLIIVEKRIGFKGTDLDTGVDGKNKVDIMYLLSTDSGDNFSGPYTVGKESTGANDAVSDPVVYYNKSSNKIYIIASSGAGLSRTRDYYYDRSIKSKFRYIVGTVRNTEAEASIDWSAGWQDLNLNGQLKLDREIQFGTHSARGVMSEDGKTLVLTVITADLNYTGLEWEAMGAQFFKVTEANGTLTFGDKIGVTIEIPVPIYERASIFKEAEAVDYNGGKIDYMIVPNPRFRTIMGKGSSSYNSVSEVSGLKGAEGSFGYLKLSKGWFGTNNYDPSTYLDNTNGADATLFSHVASDAGRSYMYMLDKYYEPKGKSLQIAKTSKASSIDVLPDGTIIMASEKERDTSAAGYKFKIFFSRYTQKYLAEKLQ